MTEEVSLDYGTILAGMCGYSLSYVLEQQYYYNSLNNPKSYLQYELMKADLKFRQAVSLMTDAISDVFDALSKSLISVGESLKDLFKPLLDEYKNDVDFYENKSYNCRCRHENSVSVDQYIKRMNMDKRGVIRRNVRNHRY